MKHKVASVSSRVVIRLTRAPLIVLALSGMHGSGLAAPRQASPPAGQTAPTANQEPKHSTEGDLATIIQSGSTNTRAYRVVIHNDGSATAVTIGATHAMVTRQEFPSGTIDTKTLRRLLAEIGDVGRIPTGNCVKSVSFGTRTQISFAGKTSGDLQCIRQPSSGGDPALVQASADLSKFIQATLSQLKVKVRTSGSNE